MKISREARKAARELFNVSYVGGRLDGSRISQISQRLVELKPRGYFQILKELTRLVRLELDKRHSVVESATALPGAEQNALAQSLKTKFGSDISTDFQVNPSLLGGLRIKVGSDVWDGSISARLANFSKTFNPA